jgi:catechol 2,3-dioxygenase-like lactoylglutathione lyase family enzyme
MSDSQPVTRGVHHVGLAVSDLDGARGFFVDTLGFNQVGERPAYPAVFVSDGVVMVTLWQTDTGAQPFDRRANAGLHHLALTVADSAALDTVHAALVARNDVTIEFAPVDLGESGNRHLMCQIPGDIRLELFAPAS